MLIEDIKKLFGTPVVRNSMVDLYGAQGALLILLYKLNIVGARQVSVPLSNMLVGNSGTQPPCSIPMPAFSLSAEYLQFCPKHMGDEEYKHK